MNAQRKAIQGMFIGVCTVYIRAPTPAPDPVSGATVFTETAVITDAPCRLSFHSGRDETVSPSNGAAKVTQTVKLFIDPASDIPAGSKITVTQNGVTGRYAQSGEAAVYEYHKEIPLKLFERFA